MRERFGGWTTTNGIAAVQIASLAQRFKIEIFSPELRSSRIAFARKAAGEEEAHICQSQPKLTTLEVNTRPALMFKCP